MVLPKANNREKRKREEAKGGTRPGSGLVFYSGEAQVGEGSLELAVDYPKRTDLEWWRN